MTDAVARQRAYYEATAASYDAAHMEREHLVALHLLSAFIEMAGIRSVLDVGAGTGRAMRFLKARFPDLLIKGIEPVAGLRRQGHLQGIPEEDLIFGDGGALPFEDGSFDLVCEFGVLHHVPRPQVVVAEMIRVAAKMVAISDCNFMGQGPSWLRTIKWMLWRARLWPLADWLKTRGKGYTYSEGDGIAYSYSIFQNVEQLRATWKEVGVIATAPNHAKDAGPMKGASHALLIAQSRLREPS
ncbi:class I SAM-dependent methyltransferase [Labrys monachus]|uniref:Ubiquinone/menaquinone biosynthesis C-methylase UbiE n=1 Tax=Labrys monachus TaxID=217067 RepID=A0ABU0FL63_9HYPH|nr:class I SAM-dependent methyltransferase [Labrys monachus]MDQ0394785.1 ubiquinone/menaquinone biosynthesis C-methylase UbiE [Labrys monachus]